MMELTNTRGFGIDRYFNHNAGCVPRYERPPTPWAVNVASLGTMSVAAIRARDDHASVRSSTTRSQNFGASPFEPAVSTRFTRLGQPERFHCRLLWIAEEDGVHLLDDVSRHLEKRALVLDWDHGALCPVIHA